jgi:hypothetical protein
VVDEASDVAPAGGVDVEPQRRGARGEHLPHHLQRGEQPGHQAPGISIGMGQAAAGVNRAQGRASTASRVPPSSQATRNCMLYAEQSTPLPALRLQGPRGAPGTVLPAW